MKNLLTLRTNPFMLSEGVMSEIDIMAKEARNVKEFIKEFMAEFGDKVKDNAETKKWLESMYKDAVNEKSKGLWANIHAKRKKGEKPARKGSKAYKKAKKAADQINNEDEELDEIDSGLNESERPRFKKRDRIQYRLTHQGGVGKYANAISQSDHVETGVIAKRTRTLAGFKYMLTTGLELSDHEILGLAESVTESKNTKELTKIFRKEFEEFPFDYREEGSRIIIDPNGYNPDGTLFSMKDDWREDIIRVVQKKKKNWHIAPNMGGGLTIHVKESHVLTLEDFVAEAKEISRMKIDMMGSKVLRKIKIGTTFVTDGGNYIVTGFGQKSNAFQEFEAEKDGKPCKVKLTAMYGVKLEVTDDPRSAVYRKEERLNSILFESVNEEASPYELDAEAFTAELEKVNFISPNIDVSVGPSRWARPGELRFRDHVTLRTVGNEMELYIIPVGKGTYELYTDKSYNTGRELKKGDAKTIVKAMKRYVNKMNESLDEAKLSKIYNAAKKGSYPISLVATENDKVIKQELVGTPEIVPAAFNQLQKEYPNAKISIESRTGKTLFVESVNESRDDVVFVIDDGNLDNKFLMTRSLSRNLDYQHDSGDQYYVLPKRDFDRLEDYADSHGYGSESIYVIDESLSESNKYKKEAEDILQDLKDERGGIKDLHGMSMEDALDTVDTYGWKDSKQQKIAKELVALCNESVSRAQNIKIGEIVTIKKYNAMRNRKEIVEVEITDYIKKPGSKDFVEYKHKGKKNKVSINVFKSIMESTLNEKKQLPKEISKHKDIPSWARYVAQQSDGEWTWFEETPTMMKWKDGGGWKSDGNQTYTGVKTDGKDWDKMPTYYYVKNGKITESRRVLTLENFLNEELPTQEINPNKFQNPYKKDKDFFKKGFKDDSVMDDAVETKPVQIPANRLKPSQDAVYLGKALGMAIGGVEGGNLEAVISQDNRILDGHHRWAATIFNNPRAKVGGVQAQLRIGDLVPVLRQAGDALGNERGLPPKTGDKNIFKATLKDVRDAVYLGKYMNPEFYNKDKAVQWYEEKGEDNVMKSLQLLQKVSPPAGAPPRADMPKIKPEQVKQVAKKLQGGAIDVRAPYVGDENGNSKGKGLSKYLQKESLNNMESIESFIGKKREIIQKEEAEKNRIESKRIKSLTEFSEDWGVVKEDHIDEIAARRGRWTQIDPVKDKELDSHFYDLINVAYAEIGGHVKIKKPEDVFADKEWTYWKGVDLHGAPDLDLIVWGKNTKFGVKFAGVGHDGEKASRKEYLNSKGSDLKKLGYYGEVSGKLAEILMIKYGVPVVTDEAEVEAAIGGKNVEWHGQHPTDNTIPGNGWYTRTIGGGKHTKILVGRPK